MDKILDKDTKTWFSFAKEKLINAIEKYNNLSAPGPDKLTWSHVKRIIKSKECINRFIDITNACINLGHWLDHFKMSMAIIIPKLNKISYDTSKSFCPIILLNTIGKLFEKVIGEHLQFHTISNSFIHSYQLSGLKQRSTNNADIALTYFIWLGWVKNLTTSILAFDITQFYLFFNYQLIPCIINKAELDCKVSIFFKDHLVGRKTNTYGTIFFCLFVV